MGGSAEAITETVRRGYQAGMDLAAAIRLAVRALSTDGGPNAAPRELGASALEVAILDRTRALPRKFRRINGSWLAGLLADPVAPARSRAGGAARPSLRRGARDRARAHGRVTPVRPDRSDDPGRNPRPGVTPESW